MSDELELEVIAQDIDRLLGEATDNAVAVMRTLGNISGRWNEIRGDLEDNATDDDCAFIYGQIIELIPNANKLNGRGYQLASQFDNTRQALGLSEGDSPPCKC